VIEVRGLHHLGLTVTDRTASCSWARAAGYGEPVLLSLAGADPAVGNGLPEASLEVAFVSAPGLTLELVQFDPPAGSTVGPGDRAFGAVPVWAAAAADHDPEGRPGVPGNDPLPLRLTSADVDSTSRLLGVLGFATAGPLGASGATVVGHGARVEIAAVDGGRPVPANKPGRVHLGLEVADLGAATVELAAHGYGLVSSPRVHGDLSWVFVAHPEGPGIELIATGA